MLHLSPACSAHGRPRAQGQRVMLGRQLVGGMIRPNAAHTVLLLRYFGGKQKSATLRILRKVLPPQLPLKLAAFQDETNLEYKAGMIWEDIGSGHLQLVECTSSLEKVRPLDSCRALLLFLLLGIFTLHLGDFIHLDDFPTSWFSAGTVWRSQCFWSFNGHDPSISSHFHNFWTYLKKSIICSYSFEFWSCTFRCDVKRHWFNFSFFQTSHTKYGLWTGVIGRRIESRDSELSVCADSWIQKSLQYVVWWGAVIFSRSRI